MAKTKAEVAKMVRAQKIKQFSKLTLEQRKIKNGEIMRSARRNTAVGKIELSVLRKLILPEQKSNKARTELKKTVPTTKKKVSRAELDNARVALQKKPVPKGSHRMPDGSIMKDSAMKKKPAPKKTPAPKKGLDKDLFFQGLAAMTDLAKDNRAEKDLLSDGVGGDRRVERAYIDITNKSVATEFLKLSTMIGRNQGFRKMPQSIWTQFIKEWAKSKGIKVGGFSKVNGMVSYRGSSGDGYNGISNIIESIQKAGEVQSLFSYVRQEIDKVKPDEKTQQGLADRETAMKKFKEGDKIRIKGRGKSGDLVAKIGSQYHADTFTTKYVRVTVDTDTGSESKNIPYKRFFKAEKI